MQPPWSPARRARVGLLVATSLALFVALLVFVVGVSFGANQLTYYLLLDESVKGLVVGSTVNFQGVPVGSVRDIRFQQGKTRVELSFDPTRATVQQVTRARLDRAFVTGQVTVELEGYAREGARLPSGSLIEPVPSAMTQLTAALPDVAQELSALITAGRELLGGLNELLDEPGRGQLRTVLRNVETMSATLPARLDDTLGEVQGLIGDARDAVATLERNAGAVGELVTDPEVRAAIRAARRAAEDLAVLEQRTLALVDELAGVVGTTRAPLLALLTSARDSMTQLRALARQLSAAPSSLFFGGPAREIVPGAARLPGGPTR